MERQWNWFKRCLQIDHTLWNILKNWKLVLSYYIMKYWWLCIRLTSKWQVFRTKSKLCKFIFFHHLLYNIYIHYGYPLSILCILEKLTNLFMLYLTRSCVNRYTKHVFDNKKIPRLGVGGGGETQIFLWGDFLVICYWYNASFYLSLTNWTTACGCF